MFQEKNNCAIIEATEYTLVHLDYFEFENATNLIGRNYLIDNSNKHRTNGCIAVAIQESGFESSRCQMLLKAIG